MPQPSAIALATKDMPRADNAKSIRCLLDLQLSQSFDISQMPCLSACRLNSDNVIVMSQR